METFYLDDYLAEKKPHKPSKYSGGAPGFSDLCASVKQILTEEWEKEENKDYLSAIELQKRAIIGYENETSYFKEKIRLLLTRLQAEKTEFPGWYGSLEEAVFAENWGFAGVTEWFSQVFLESSSAKIIGERIFFLQNGKMRLMPQKIGWERREQLIRALLLLTPEERLDKEFHEVYLLDGTRVTIFRGAMTKQQQDAVIFRRYVVPCLTFEEQAARKTIPAEAIPLFRSMVACGFNVVFLGQIRSAKTTFLATWQGYEDPCMEGVMVETDPEIPLHKLMPDSPVLQILADQERLERISKNLMRSDADYFIFAEARDGNALDTAVRIAGKGTRHMKMTFHCGDPLSFAYDAAWEITGKRGGDLRLTARKVAASFDYIFHFVHCRKEDVKRLRSIHELSFDHETEQIRIWEICRYDQETSGWVFRETLNREKQTRAAEEDGEAAESFAAQLASLAKRFPMREKEEMR